MKLPVPKTSGTAILICILAFFRLLPCFSQEPLTIVRSNIIKEIDGKEYYIHTIKKGQSLYMISKAYGIDVNLLITENPEVKKGIQPGQKIRIHVNPGEEPPKKEVKPVIIPEKPKEEPKKDETTVKPDEEVETGEIPSDQPKREVHVQPELSPAEPPIPCGAEPSAKKELYDIALFIPLYLSELDQINVDNPSPEEVEEYNPLRFIQFYEGFRLAADSLGKAGVRARIHVYDAIRDTNNTRKILSKPEMKKMDLIIGLVYQKDFQVIATFGNKQGIPVVNPLSERDQITEGNPMVIKVRPSLTSQAAELAAYLNRDYPGENVIIIRDARFKESPEPESLKNECAGTDMKVMLLDGYSDLFGSLSKDKTNILIVYTVNKVFALEFLTKINEFRNDYDIIVVGLPRWDEMEDLETEYLVNMETHMMSPSFVDYDDPEIKKFLVSFREKYKTDPDILAFQGFDVAACFLTALNKYGLSLDQCLHDFSMPGLQTAYRFSRLRGNGYENMHWDIFKYENFRVKKVNFLQ